MCISRRATNCASIHKRISKRISMLYIFDNNKLRANNNEKSKIIDSLRLELTKKEFEYEKFDILMDVLDSATIFKID